MSQLKMIVVSPNIPRPWSGASTRNYHLLRALAAEHSVALVALNELPGVDVTVPVEHLRTFAREVAVIAPVRSGSKRIEQVKSFASLHSYTIREHQLPAVQAALDQLFAAETVDAVLFESAQMAGYRIPPSVRVIIDQHNLEYELRLRAFAHETSLSRKVFNWLEYRLLRPVEIARCRAADAVAVTSERERDILRALAPQTRIAVVPNGVDLDAFEPVPASHEVAGRIVFTGALTYQPNVQATLFFAERIWPQIQRARPSATWQIVGRYPPPEVQRLGELPGVSVTGAVPDVRPYLAAAQVAVAPLLVGSGTRMKILEAFAMGKAVVSTSVGCEGLPVMSGEHLSVADDPESFAAAVVTLLDQPEIRARYGSAGRALALAGFGWEVSGNALLELIAGIQVRQRETVWQSGN